MNLTTLFANVRRAPFGGRLTQAAHGTSLQTLAKTD
ncbi:hypothetical protein QO002_004513 [Pararhizobium capsulatum DSM 1112]|uniref:Uncharacterized protein n=1 Tax=Pararhizobium capsulatum DSM 1112 TaxID=1121113 RepID=A0ABU0BWI0_9HYPH|nr:hypothetical protein [Pararhizobium capsulatum DSM 1112]